MYCDACGGAIQTGQSFCSKCGKQIVGAIVTMPRGRVQSHVHLLGIFWMAFSAFDTVGAVVLYVLANSMFAEVGRSAFLRPLLSVIAILLLAKAALGFLAGWGLLQSEKWARVLALVMGFVSLFTNIPIGTALGVYTMWVLMSAESESEYNALSEARAA